MQVNYFSLGSINKNSKQKTDFNSLNNDCSHSYAENLTVPSSQNLKAIYLNNVAGKNKLAFGHSLDENLHSWGANLNKDGSKFKVWAKWAQQVFVQAVPADSEDPSIADKTLPEYKKSSPWYYDAQKVKFIVKDNSAEGKTQELEANAETQKINNIDKKTLIIPHSHKDQIWELNKTSNDGIFESSRLPQVKAGYKYRYIFVNSDGIINYQQDPVSHQLDNVSSWSTVFDHSKFNWGRQKRTPQKNNPNILSAPDTKAFAYAHNKNNASQINEYSIHLGTISKDGTYESAKRHIDKLSKTHKGITHVEIMPLETTFSQNWGYDGTSSGKFAPTSHYNGKTADPNALKDLIKYTQDKGLGVIIDMVPNHYSHDFGDHLDPFGPYESRNQSEKAAMPWGKAYNYEPCPGNDSVSDKNDIKKVRDYTARMALNWLVNYNANGLRFDMTKYMKSRNTLKQIAQEVRYHVPDAMLIAEDGEVSNDGNSCDNSVTNPLSQQDAPVGKTLEEHNKAINLTANNASGTHAVGLDAQWGFHLHHTLFAVVSGENYPFHNNFPPDVQKFAGMFNDPKANTNVIFPMSHDEIGNLGGLRLIPKIMLGNLNMGSRVKGNGKVADQATQNMLEAYFNKGFCVKDHTNEQENQKWMNYQRKITFKEREYKADGGVYYANKAIEVTNPVSLTDFKNSLDYAKSCHKLALGSTFAYPAPKRIFQGDEYGAIEPFYFFRDESPGFKTGENYYNTKNDKGYDYTATSHAGAFNAFERSKLKRDNIHTALSESYDKTEAFTKKLEEINHENPALKTNNSDFTHLQTYVYNQDDNKILQVHRTDEKGNNILIVMNFGNKKYTDFTLIKNGNEKMPKDGIWKEEINSDDTAYDGKGEFVNTGNLKPDEKGNVKINIPEKGFIILKHHKSA